jgi:hypothetical protein
LLLLAGGWTAPGQATSYFWTNGGNDADWFNAQNWDSGIPERFFFDPNDIYLTASPSPNTSYGVELAKTTGGLDLFPFWPVDDGGELYVHNIQLYG